MTEFYQRYLKPFMAECDWMAHSPLNLQPAGLDVEHVMRLGGWESLDMVLRYARSGELQDSLKLCRRPESISKS